MEGKEDSEIDFTVSTGGFHILPLSIKVVVFQESSVERTGDHLEHPGGERGPSVPSVVPRREDE